MRQIAVILGVSMLLAACGKREEVTATGKRPATMREDNLMLDATNDERFGGGRSAAPTPVEPPRTPFVAGSVPDGWTEMPGSMFRLLNYRFGTAGEAYLSVSRGGVIDNVNRWLGQFGVDPVDAAGLAKMEAVDVHGHQGVWVSVEGNFGGGMGKEAQGAWALRGLIADGPSGLLTVKMIGPLDEVKANEAKLKGFVAGLTTAD